MFLKLSRRVQARDGRFVFLYFGKGRLKVPRMFVTEVNLSGGVDTNKKIQIELMIPEETANNLGDALISGSLGVIRELTV